MSNCTPAALRVPRMLSVVSVEVPGLPVLCSPRCCGGCGGCGVLRSAAVPAPPSGPVSCCAASLSPCA
eukprot:4529811-Alexandrium_andersonii.AAC.1